MSQQFAAVFYYLIILKIHCHNVLLKQKTTQKLI